MEQLKEWMKEQRDDMNKVKRTLYGDADNDDRVGLVALFREMAKDMAGIKKIGWTVTTAVLLYFVAQLLKPESREAYRGSWDHPTETQKRSTPKLDESP